MKRWKYHPESGAYEFFQTEDEKMLLKASKTTEQLTAENTQLKNNLSGLLEMLTQKNIITVEEANQFLPEDSTINTKKSANKIEEGKSVIKKKNIR